MPVINLEFALKRIKSIYDQRVSSQNKNFNAHLYPFFFITGAGISQPSIPLAAEMMEYFKKQIETNGDKIPDQKDTKDVQDYYSKLFQQAYPAPIERRDYLRDIMQEASISEANSSLAHLLLKNRNFCNLVVTSNFDVLLSRALNLFISDPKDEPVIFDHPDALSRIRQGLDDKIQIFHAHGTYRFYDCCNLSFGIENRKQRGDNYYTSAYTFLLETLNQKIPIIIGYSGWDDVIKNALLDSTRESSPPYQFFWICHSLEALEKLDKKIQQSNNFFLVVNDKSIVGIVPYNEYSDKLNKYIAEKQEHPVDKIEANEFLSELKKILMTHELEIFTDPINFFLKRLELLFPRKIQSQNLARTYDFDIIKTKVRNSLKANAPKPGVPKDIAEEKIRHLTSLNTIGKFASVIVEVSNFFRGKKVDEFEVNILTSFAKPLFISLDNFFSLADNEKPIQKIKEALLLFTEINNKVGLIKKYDEVLLISRIGRSLKDPDKQLAFEIYDLILKENINTNDIRILKSLAKYECAKLAKDLYGNESAIKLHKELINEFKDESILKVKENVVRSLYALGIIHDYENKREVAQGYYQEIVNRFEDQNEGSLPINIANAHLSLARNYKFFAENSLNQLDFNTNKEFCIRHCELLRNEYSSYNDLREFKVILNQTERIYESAIKLRWKGNY